MGDLKAMFRYVDDITTMSEANIISSVAGDIDVLPEFKLKMIGWPRFVV